MTSIMRGLITLHVACQKMLGLCPIMKTRSLLNLSEKHMVSDLTSLQYVVVLIKGADMRFLFFVTQSTL